MDARREYRDRADTQVEVLDALADRREEGMTVFELRTRVDVDIDSLEAALAELKSDDLIEVTEEDSRTVIMPDEDVVAIEDNGEDGGLLEELRRRFPL